MTRIECGHEKADYRKLWRRGHRGRRHQADAHKPERDRIPYHSADSVGECGRGRDRAVDFSHRPVRGIPHGWSYDYRRNDVLSGMGCRWDDTNRIVMGPGFGWTLPGDRDGDGPGACAANRGTKTIGGSGGLSAIGAIAGLRVRDGAGGGTLFGLLSTRNPETAALFFDMVRHGPGVLSGLPIEQAAHARAEIARAFSGVFLLVAGISCISVAMSATLRVRREVR
jgi:hypothetical protein